MARKLNEAQQIALRQGLISAPSQLGISHRKSKRFVVQTKNGPVHFGIWPFSGEGTFLDHKSPEKRKNWYARHRAQNPKAIKDPSSPLFWAARILW